MGRIIILSAMFFIFANECNAQFEQGRSEVSFMGSMGSYSYKEDATGSYPYSYSQSSYYLALSTIYDYYILTGFSLEPEVSLAWVERSKPGVYLLANLSYTQSIPGSPVALFGRIGYGVANSIEVPMYFGSAGKVTDDLKIRVFNAGVGTKILINKYVLMRLELNYRSHDWKNDYGFGASYDETWANIGVLGGFSILF